MRKLIATLVAVTAMTFGSGVAEATPDTIERAQTIQVEREARAICDAQTYGRQNEVASGACYHAVAHARGWSLMEVARWEPFVILEDNGILYGESEHCPGRRGGDRVTDACVQLRDGPGEDIGFGQATTSWWGRNGLVCRNHGYCSPEAILASPYDEMLATVILIIEYDGSHPWCFSPRLIKYHRCNQIAPDR